MTFAEVVRGIIARRAKGTQSNEEADFWVPRLPVQEPSRAEYPRFRASATDRPDLAPFGEARVRLRSAFRPSQPIMSLEMLAGRLSLLRDLISAVEDQRAHVVLHGERGIGKTSLLRVFSEIAKEAGYIVVYENCRANSSFEVLFRSVAAQVPARYFEGLDTDEMQETDGKSLADLFPDSPITADALARVFAGVVGTRLLIILDEFDRVLDPEFKRKVAELIKDLSDASASTQLVIAGVAENLRDLLGSAPSIRRNVRALSVEPMTESEVGQIIAIGEKEAGLRFEAAARDAIISTSVGLPHVAQMLAHFAAFAALDSKRLSISARDVELAISKSAQVIQKQLSVDARQAADRLLETDRQSIGRLARGSLLALKESDSDGISRIAAQAGSSDATIGRLARVTDFITTDSTPAGEVYGFREEGLALYLHLRASGAARKRERTE